MTKETYRPEFDEQVRKLCLSGTRITAIADFFGVSVSAIKKWQRTKESFRAAYNSGRLASDIKIKPGSRQEIYRPEFDEQAFKICLLGATNIELGAFFGISDTQVEKWMREKSSFGDACRRGKTSADAEVVNSLYRNALGYSFIEEQVFTSIENGIPVETIKKITRHKPSDTVACIFWLKNRRRASWKDRWDVTASGPNGEPLPSKIEFVFKDGKSMKDITPDHKLITHEG